MCQKRNSVVSNLYYRKTFRVDSCLRHFMEVLRNKGIKTVACCCGHGKYPLTVICKDNNIVTSQYYELISGVRIKRTRNFYKKDKEGFYYIPEVINC